MEWQAPRPVRRDDTFSSKLAFVLRESPSSTLWLLRRLLAAKLALRKATSVGQYVKLSGRMRVVNDGKLTVGNRVLFHAQVATTELVVMKGAELRIGDGSFLNYGAEICAYQYIEIGEECRIGTHCIIMDNDFHHVELDRRDEVPPSVPVVLEPYVWLGNRVTVLKGVRIGYGSVVAAGSVVTKSLPPMCIAGGVPARIIGRIEETSRVVRLPGSDNSVKRTKSSVHEDYIYDAGNDLGPASMDRSVRRVRR